MRPHILMHVLAFMSHAHMEGFSQPQHFFAAGCVFANFRVLCMGPFALLLETFFVDP